MVNFKYLNEVKFIQEFFIQLTLSASCLFE